MINNKVVESGWFHFEKKTNCEGANLSMKLKPGIK